MHTCVGVYLCVHHLGVGVCLSEWGRVPWVWVRVSGLRAAPRGAVPRLEVAGAF